MCTNLIEIKKTLKSGQVELIKVPCGKCLSCMQKKAIDTAIRGSIEYDKYKNNEGVFITLTYNTANMPDNRSLKKQHYVEFIRELRRQIKSDEDRTGIRILGCGEYGTEKGRPHYHLVIFNWKPTDLTKTNKFKSENGQLYTSEYIEKIWQKGNVIIGQATKATVGYIAGYTNKKGLKGKTNRSRYIMENVEENIKKSYWQEKNGILIQNSKSTSEKYITRKKTYIKEKYLKEEEFISQMKGTSGGLGCINEENKLIKLVNGMTIPVMMKSLKIYEIPYYYKKKLKEIYENRIKIKEKDKLKLWENEEIQKLCNNDFGKYAKIIESNQNMITKIEETIMKIENYTCEKLTMREEQAKKNNMTMNEWNHYQENIRKRKIMAKLVAKKRDFDRENNGKRWLNYSDIETMKKEGDKKNLIKYKIYTEKPKIEKQACIMKNQRIYQKMVKNDLTNQKQAYNNEYNRVIGLINK